ncbi:MAG: hypothetical protein L3J07_04740 [Candidatus Magasanikbacteria bacterium]|nr:hypothetical protein [Candidatus Magasanikbacteria bacterium]
MEGVISSDSNKGEFYFKRIKLFLDRLEFETQKDIERKRNSLGYLVDEISGNTLDDYEAYVVCGKFITDKNIANLIKKIHPELFIETVPQINNRLIQKEKAFEEKSLYQHFKELSEKYNFTISLTYKLKPNEKVFIENIIILGKVERRIKTIFSAFIDQIRESCIVPGSRSKNMPEGIITNSKFKKELKLAKHHLWLIWQLFPRKEK